jgi:hypothetical protein
VLRWGVLLTYGELNGAEKYAIINYRFIKSIIENICNTINGNVLWSCGTAFLIEGEIDAETKKELIREIYDTFDGDVCLSIGTGNSWTEILNSLKESKTKKFFEILDEVEFVKDNYEFDEERFVLKEKTAILKLSIDNLNQKLSKMNKDQIVEVIRKINTIFGNNIIVGLDTVYIIGNWKNVLNSAFNIRNALKRLGLTTSAGFGIFNSSIPIENIIKTLNNHLNTAKLEGGDRVYLFNRKKPNDGFCITYNWDELEKMRKKYFPKFKKVSKSLLWKILEFHNLYVRNPKSLIWHYNLAYHLARNNADKLFSDLLIINSNNFKNNKPQEIYHIDGLIKLYLLEERG